MHAFILLKQNLIWPYFYMPLKDKWGIIKKKKKDLKMFGHKPSTAW